MKRFLSLILTVVLLISTVAIAANAVTGTTYWSVNSACLVKSKLLADNTVLSYKPTTGDCDGLLLGIPTDAVYGDDFFQAKDGYKIKYFDISGKQITSASAHIGTNVKVVVYDSNDNIVAKYGLVTYGDADGDGVFDVIDAYLAALCLNGFVKPEESAAIYESVKPRADYDNENVDILDYQQIVNDVVSNDTNREENQKGRKKLVDETVSMESVIYAYDGKAKNAPFNAINDDFKAKAVTLTYNGNSTAPSEPGIYTVSAVISENDYYLVTPRTVDLGFMMIAPKNSTGYTVSVDNASKKVVVNIDNFYTSDATFDSYVNAWYNSAYNLKMGGNAVTSATGAVSALSPRTVKKYTHSAKNLTIVDATDLLGCYLPDDYTLWNDENANKTVSVSVDKDGFAPLNFTFVIQQDKGAIETLRQNFHMTNVNAARGQRYDNPATAANAEGLFGRTKKKVMLEGKNKFVSETNSRQYTIRVVNCGSSSTYPSMTDAFDGTGLKTILVGYTDSLCFTSAATKAGLGKIDANATLLYDTGDSNRRYSNYSGTEIVTNSSTFLGIVNKVLGGMNISLSIVSKTSALNNKTGWCRYACSGATNGLRYTMDYYLEFADANSTNDNQHAVNVVAVDGCTITTTPAQTATYTQKDDDGNVIATFYHKDRLTMDEPFRVSATIKAGYKLSVTDASGNPVEYDAKNGWYIMPNSNVTVTAVPQ